MGHTSSRGKGKEIPDALELDQTLDLADKIITGDAIFCQREIVSKIAEKNGDYLVSAKENQRDLRKEITTAFNEPFVPSMNALPHQKPITVGLNNDRSPFCQRRLSASTYVNDGQAFDPLSGLIERENT